MRFGPMEVKDKFGRKIILRNAEVSDSENLIKYMQTITAETPFLIREPDEFHITLEQEEAFVNGRIDNEREVIRHLEDELQVRLFERTHLREK